MLLPSWVAVQAKWPSKQVSSLRSPEEAAFRKSSQASGKRIWRRLAGFEPPMRKDGYEVIMGREATEAFVIGTRRCRPVRTILAGNATEQS